MQDLYCDFSSYYLNRPGAWADGMETHVSASWAHCGGGIESQTHMGRRAPRSDIDGLEKNLHQRVTRGTAETWVL